MQLRQQLERLTDAYFRAVIPLHEYERRRRDLEQRVSALAKQEEQLRDDAERQRQLAGLAASLEVFRERVQRGLAQANFEQRRQLALLLIDRVVVTDAEVEIRYVLPTSPESEHVRFCHLRKTTSTTHLRGSSTKPRFASGVRTTCRAMPLASAASAGSSPV